MKSSLPPIRPRSWALRTSASIAALAVGAIGVVGFATVASAVNEQCVPADEVSHVEHTYTRTLTQWSATSPGGGWTATGNQIVVVDSPAVTHTELEYRKWSNGQNRYNYQWYRQDSPPPANSGWELSGASNVVVDKPAVTHVDHEYTSTETSGWLTASPGSGWTVSATRTVVDTEAVVCEEADPSVTASGLRFRAGQSLDLLAQDFLPGEDVDFVMHSDPVFLGRGLANLAGSATVPSAVIPTSAPAGWHTIVATGGTSGRTASTTIEVLPAESVPGNPADTSTGSATPASTGGAASVSPVPEALAATGNESLALLGLAASLALIGAGLVGVRRVAAPI